MTRTDPSPDLSPDLEWMLLGGQADEAQLASALVEAHGADLFELAYLLLGDRVLAEKASTRVLAQAVLNAHRYPARMPVLHWLFSLVARHFKTPWIWLFLTRKDPCGVFCQFRPQERFVLALRYFFDLSIPEIAHVLSIQEGSLEKHIGKLEKKLRGGSSSSDAPQKVALPTSASRTGPLRHTMYENPAGKVEIVLDEIERSRARKKRLALLQGALTFLLGALVVLISTRAFVSDTPALTPPPPSTALLSRFTPTPTDIPEYAVQYVPAEGETLADIARKTWIDMEILEAINRIPADQKLEAGVPVILGFRPPTQAANQRPTTTPWPLPPPLTAQSSPAEIRQRVSENQHYWHTLWADGLVIRYGDSGYIGPPQIIRQQLWIVQPDQRLTLSGLPDGDLLSASLKTGSLENNFDFRTGEKTTQGSFVYYELDQLISPFWQDYPEGSSSSPMFEGDLKVVRGDRVAGRPAVVLDWIFSSDPGSSEGGSDGSQPMYMGRYWVDALTGVILRQQEFSRLNPDLLTAEVVVTRIAYDVEIPGRLFDTLAPIPARLAWDHLGEELPEDYVWEPPMPFTVRSLLPRLSPPPDFDPTHNRLTFQRYASNPEKTGEFVPVDIFADRYYLGTVPMGDLFDIICARSPDGRYLAYTYQGESLGTVSLLYLLDLTNPTKFQVASLTRPILASYSFSEDSQQLNWIACDERFRVCDIGILDIQTRVDSSLFGFNNQGQVLDSESGKVIGRIIEFFPLTIEMDDKGEFDQIKGFFPGERITIDLGEYPASPGLEACAAPAGEAP